MPENQHDATPPAPDQVFGSLMNSLAGTLAAGEALSTAAHLLDVSLDLGRRDGIQRVIDVLSGLDQRDLTPIAVVQLEYCLGDAYGGLSSLDRQGGSTQPFWGTLHIANSLLHLKLAVQKTRQVLDMAPDYRSAILNSLGNALNSTGRLIPAIHAWDDALADNASFPMALGNRGCALYYYGRSVHDESHAFLLWKRALGDLRTATEADMQSEPEAAQAFRQQLAFLEKVLPIEFLDEPIDWNRDNPQMPNDERAYRQWCSDKRLFLHPLNDLGPTPLGAYDPVCTPTMTLCLGEGEYFQGFFNEMKQEFVSARFLLFEALHSAGPHFSDRDVTLADTLDDPAYSLSTQKLRIAFRSAASLFDKAAVFLNHYLKLAIPERQVTFRVIWYTKQDRKQGMRQEFVSRDNAWLRALFALSLDTFDGVAGFAEVSDPDAKTIYEIRNYAEQKFLKLHRSAPPPDKHGIAASNHKVPRPLSLSQSDFADKAEKLMRTTRELLICLSLMIREEERQRSEKDHTPALPLPWVPFPHERKV
jgi:hypothetical protein